MKASDIFTPIYRYQIEHGLKPTNKQISESTGINTNRLKTIRDNPARATVAELETLTREYHYRIEVGL